MKKHVQLALLAFVLAMASTALFPSAWDRAVVQAEGTPTEKGEAGEAPIPISETSSEVEEVGATRSASLDERIPTVVEMIQLASAHYGLNVSWMKRIAWCESKYGAETGSRYLGVYQFDWNTWTWWSARAGFAEVTPHDQWANIWTAHYLAKYGNPYKAWPTCSKV